MSRASPPGDVDMDMDATVPQPLSSITVSVNNAGEPGGEPAREHLMEVEAASKSSEGQARKANDGGFDSVGIVEGAGVIKDLDDKPDAKVVVVNNLTRNVVESHLRAVFGFYGEIVKVDLPLYGRCELVLVYNLYDNGS
jgi:hypothetical protein